VQSLPALVLSKSLLAALPAKMKQSIYLLLLTIVLLISAALSIGLAYVPCYSSLCSEDFFPYETRIHNAFFYGLLASIGVFLLLRVYSPSVLRLSRTHLVSRPLPVLGCRISVGGLLLAVWSVGLTVATTGFWYWPAREFWDARAKPLDWAQASVSLTVTTIIGHHVDLLLGLVLLPIGRNSLLGRVFELHTSTLLLAHKLLAYATIATAFAHGTAYYVRFSPKSRNSWTAVRVADAFDSSSWAPIRLPLSVARRHSTSITRL
jgi:ferric-chelate reductase